MLRISELPDAGDFQVLQIDSRHDWRHLHPKQALYSSWLHRSSSYDFRPHFLHNRRPVRLAQVRHDGGEYSCPGFKIRQFFSERSGAVERFSQKSMERSGGAVLSIKIGAERWSGNFRKFRFFMYFSWIFRELLLKRDQNAHKLLLTL